MLTRTIFHVWGPFCIYSYGIMIAVGCIITYYLMLKDPKRAAIITESDLIQLFSVSILIGILGGRVLYILAAYDQLNSWFEICTVYEGGFSILGTIIALLLFIPWYLKSKHVPVLPLLDLCAIYAPLLQSISRLGCFFAGCCYGKPSSMLWAIQYTDPDTLAPLHCWLHPTQLYSSILLLVIFLIIYFWAQYKVKKPGKLMCLYIGLTSGSRFMVDFLRNDREFFSFGYNLLSMHQLIALGLMTGAGILYWTVFNKR